MSSLGPSRRRAAAVLPGALATITLAACGGGSSSDGASGGEPGTAPDINGDGKVVIGVLSPGDINDRGYYQGFVDEADAFAKEQGWEIIKRGSVDPADGLTAARALCQQKVDMVALAASELKDAVPASEEPVCKDTVFYTQSSANIEQTPRVIISSDDPTPSIFATGYAAGLKLVETGGTKAGFVTGEKADFSVAASEAFIAGIRQLVPDATLVTTYTGDFDDSAKAKEAVQAQVSQGVNIVYPYLGGATDAAAAAAQEGGAMTLTPGTDRCDSTDPKFDVSAIFSPGAFFRISLEEFAKDNLEVGTTRNWKIGVDKYPTVKLCDASEESNTKLQTFLADMGADKIDAAAEVERLKD